MHLPPVLPGATIGILGNGPTTRYFTRIAHQMGYRFVVIDPALSPAQSRKAISSCDVVTSVDHLPAAAMRTVAAHQRVHPSPEIVELCADRVQVKSFLDELGVAVGPYVLIGSDDDVAAASDTKFSAILKLRHHGEGRAGQVRVATHAELGPAWASLGQRQCVLEQRMTLGRELAVTVARASDGRTAAFAVSQQQYIHGRLEISYAPASLLGSGHADAADLGTYIATELGLIGVLAVHMFVVGREVYVHELIPRPTAVGVFTLDSCRTDQYEQHLRAVCGLALGDTTMTVPGIAVVGLRDDVWAAGEPKWERVLADHAVHVHLYDSPVGDCRGHLAACSGTAAGSTSVVRRLRKELASG